MSDKRPELIALLADGRFHSGEKLGAAIGVSRASVWKYIQTLSSLGLDIDAVSGRGYRLRHPVELLNRATIKAELSNGSSRFVSQIETLQILDSTNAYLMREAPNSLSSGAVCFSEYQAAGRGRRGRSWHSPFGSNIYFSVLWRFQDGASRLGGLSLAMAVALMRALHHLGVEGAGIKWPNDILCNQSKLAGILVEVAGESNGPCYAVIGIGINHAMPDLDTDVISQSWTDLRRCGLSLGRNKVAGAVLDELIKSLIEYQHSGFDAFQAEWRHWDIIAGKNVSISQGSECLVGQAKGIDENGLLIVELSNGIRRFSSGEVSLRAVSP